MAQHGLNFTGLTDPNAGAFNTGFSQGAKSQEFGFNNSTFNTGANAIQGLAGLGQLYLGAQNLDLAKDTFAFNKANANRNFLANKEKFNNAVARTQAVDKQFGVNSVAKKLT